MKRTNKSPKRFWVVVICLGLTLSLQAQQRKKPKGLNKQVTQPQKTTPKTADDTKPVAIVSPNDPLTGEWDLERKVLEETSKFKLRLKLDGERITGSLESKEASKPIIRGSWHNGKLEIAYGDPNDPAVMTGYFRKEQLWGRITLSEKEKIFLDKLTGVWMAKRISPSRPSPKNQRMPAASQIKKIGIVFGTLTARFRGTEQLVGEKMRKALEEESSESNEKLPVVLLKSLDDAIKEGADVVFSLEYREEPGKSIRSAAMGNVTNIYCRFKRLDSATVRTTWDNLNLEDTGEFTEFLLPYSTAGIGGSMADLGLYGMCFASFKVLIPTLEIETMPADKSSQVRGAQDE